MIILSLFLLSVFLTLLHGFIKGLRGYTLEDIEVLEDQQNELTADEIEAIEHEIITLEIAIERRKEIASIVENELLYCKPSKRATLLTRLNTLDKQSFNDQRKIYILEKKLE